MTTGFSTNSVVTVSLLAPSVKIPASVLLGSLPKFGLNSIDTRHILSIDRLRQERVQSSVRPIHALEIVPSLKDQPSFVLIPQSPELFDAGLNLYDGRTDL